MSGRPSSGTELETYRITSAEGQNLMLVAIGAGQALEHAMPSHGTFVIGRGHDCDVRLDLPQVSRRHARLRVGSVLQLEDLKSANGVFVRGRRLGHGETTMVRVGEPIQLGDIFVAIIRTSEAVRRAPLEARELRPESPADPDLIVADPTMERLVRTLKNVARSGLSTLLIGETGVGKEMVARAIHHYSPRARSSFVAVNCSALPAGLIESELFGHERGAFTGAEVARPGLFEEAHGGTLFLDEIGEMPLSAQSKLLRALETFEIRRVGGTSGIKVDCHAIAATNRDLEEEVRLGRFRADLYFRLSGIVLEVPPLRERLGDIAPLARSFFEQSGARDVSPEVFVALTGHRFPGNVRELRNIVSYASAMAAGHRVDLDHLPPTVRPKAGSDADGDLRGRLRAYERSLIIEALERCNWNQSKAAQMLGIPRRTFIKRLDEYDVPRPRKGQGSDPREG